MQVAELQPVDPRAPCSPAGQAADKTPLHAQAESARRLTTSFGNYRMGLTFEPGALEGDASGWLEPLGLAADLEARFRVADVRRSPQVSFSRLDLQGCAFDAPHSSGEVDWRTATARITLARPVRLRTRMDGLAQICMALGYAEVLRRGGMLLHGATLLLAGRAVVVVGFSGAGKSTLAARFPDACLHDEHAWLVPTESGHWEVWRHAEFRGPRGDLPWRVPLTGLFVLGPDRTATGATLVPDAERMAAVALHSYHAGAPTALPMLDAVARVVQAVPVFALRHRLADPAAQVAAVLQEGCRGP